MLLPTIPPRHIYIFTHFTYFMIVFQHRIIFYIYLTAPVSEKDFPKFIDKYNRVDTMSMVTDCLDFIILAILLIDTLLVQTFAGESFVRVKKKTRNFMD